MRVPAVDTEVVEEILGSDPMQGKEEGKFTLTSIAHRGAGLDAPENSLSAFREVNMAKGLSDTFIHPNLNLCSSVFMCV